jgi:hypothetical protein
MPCFSGIDELKSANANCAASAVAAAKKKERTRMKLSEVITAVLVSIFVTRMLQQVYRSLWHY